MAFARAYRGMRRDARTLAPDEIALILASIKRAPTRTLSQQFRATTRRIVLCATVMGFTILQKVLFQMLLVSTVGFSHALTVVTNFVFIIFFLSGLSFQHRKAAEGQRLYMKFVQSNIQLFVGTGLTEAVAFTMFPWASVRVPGAMHPIIQQALLPLTMIVNFIVLGRNYSGQQMLGVAIIIVGVLVQFAPALGQIMVTSASTESHATIQGAAAVVLIIAYGFIAISLTFKEVAFKRFAQDYGMPLDIYVVDAVASLAQCGALATLWPANFALLTPFTPKRYVVLAAQTFLGAERAETPLLLILFLVASLLLRVVSLHVVQELSSDMLLLCKMLTIPVCSLTFCLPLPFLATSTFSPLLVASLIIILMGLTIFGKSKPNGKAEESQKDEEDDDNDEEDDNDDQDELEEM